MCKFVFCAHFHAPIRHVSIPDCTHRAHENGHVHQTPVRLLARSSSTQGGKYASETFLRRGDAETWARNVEHKIDRGEPILLDTASTKTFGGLIDLHKSDLAQVGKTYGRSKAASLKFLTTRLGKLKPSELDRETLIDFGNNVQEKGPDL